MGERVTPKRDFFKTDTETVQSLFDLVDGVQWAPTEITEGAWLALVDKVKIIVKQENPKANEFQINQLKMKIAGSLKGQYGENVEPTLEMVRIAMDKVGT
jgi:hypothetical protein